VNKPGANIAIRLVEKRANGDAVLLTTGILNLRNRAGNRATDTLTVVPGTVYDIEINFLDVAHTFAAGSEVQLIISGSNYPLFDLNPQTGSATGPSQPADITVYFGGSQPSALTLTGEWEAPASRTASADVRAVIVPYPNPATQAFSLDLEQNKAQQYQFVHLKDLSGKTIRTWDLESNGSYDLTGISNGLYLLQIEGQGGPISTGKLSVTH
jgi:hypothetical protein